ncbi:MAG: trypsin-like peptidase domain-containing protein [Alphaproteobacteria bacterium]|nr:trypsin-like peptidase domain-containing protein [Alphaproteobacteria bacterium]
MAFQHNVCKRIIVVAIAAAFTSFSSATIAQQRWVSYNSGTGFFVSKDGHIVTNRHVVENCLSIDVTGAVNSPATLVAQDTEKDIAILKIPRPSPMVAPLRWNLESLRIGDKVSILGYPKQAQGELRYNTSHIVAFSGLEGYRQWVQIAPVAEQGNSGGALLDNTGNVIGIVTGKLLVDTDGRYDLPAGRHNTADVAIPLSQLKNFLDRNTVRYYESASGLVQYADTRVSDMARNFTVNVRCITSIK